MITKNEEEDLPRCLERARPFVDEIILVDTGSTDETKRVAIGFGAAVVDFKWTSDFSAARNESLNHATGDWILVLDADELIAEKDFEKIRELIEVRDFDAYSLVQRNYTTDPKIFGWQPPDNYTECQTLGFTNNPIVRLFRNQNGIKFSNAVHETVVPALESTNANIAKTQITIHHYGHTKPEETRKRKRDLYLRIGLEQIKKSPNDPRPRYEVAMIYKNTGKEDKALEHLEKVAEMDPTYELVYSNLGEVHARKKHIKRAIECYKKSIELKPQDENAYINLSVIYFELARVDEAIDLLSSATEINPSCAMAYNNLVFILIRQKDFSEASKILKRAYASTGLAKFRQALEEVEQYRRKTARQIKPPS